MLDFKAQSVGGKRRFSALFASENRKNLTFCHIFPIAADFIDKYRVFRHSNRVFYKFFQSFSK